MSCIRHEGKKLMNRYDLVAFDMDGILLTSEKHVSKNTRAAIKKAAQAGK